MVTCTQCFGSPFVTMRIRIHTVSSRLGQCGPGRIQIQGFDDQKFNKFTVDLHIPRPQIRTSKLQEKPSALKREHPALQNMKLLNFFEFSIFCGHFCLFRSGSGSSRSNSKRILIQNTACTVPTIPTINDDVSH